MKSSDSKQFTITLVGDIMLGRLIDQLLPTHVDEPDEAAIISHFRQKHIRLQQYSYTSPWGNALSLFRKSDLVLGNLETSATTHNVKWPDKVFNYRMHPVNVRCLNEADINYVSLANNHTLDFSKFGLLETVRTLKDAGIAFAGAGETSAEADKPAELTLRSKDEKSDAQSSSHSVHVYSFADHPSDWAALDLFNYLEYTHEFRQKLKRLLTANEAQPALKIVSVHWGPNYRWQPEPQIRELAHFLVDECRIDVVWGHSSHHIQGVEIYKGKLIIYGCGDFVDDYAVNRSYRNDLSAAWTLVVDSMTPDGQDDKPNPLEVRRLEVRPNRIKHFQANLLEKTDPDHEWVVEKFKTLCEELGTKIEPSLGSEGQIIVDLSHH